MAQVLLEVTAIVAALQLSDLKVRLPHLFLLFGYVESIVNPIIVEHEPLLRG